VADESQLVLLPDRARLKVELSGHGFVIAAFAPCLAGFDHQRADSGNISHPDVYAYTQTMTYIYIYTCQLGYLLTRI
jgi:cyanate permease